MFPFEVIQLQLALSLAVTHGDDLEMAWTPQLQCVEAVHRRCVTSFDLAETRRGQIRPLCV